MDSRANAGKPVNASALRIAAADAWMLSLAPALPVRMPWPLAYRFYRSVARSEGLYRDAVDGAMAALDALPISDPEGFRRDVRTTLLLDVADLHLSRRHPVDWLPAHVTLEGQWPDAGAFVAVTFHYGTGLWICRALRRAGHRSRFLSGRFEAEAFARRPQLHRYGLRRLAEVERVGGAPIAYRPGVRDSLLRTLAEGTPVIGLIDLPPRLAPRGQQPLQLLDRPASLPVGLLELAHAADVPVVPCWVEIDFATGHRRVVIGEARRPVPLEPVLADLAASLDALIRRQPGAWMFWPEWRAWLRDAAPLHAGTFSNGGPEGRLVPICK
jgi:hypothetical protein